MKIEKEKKEKRRKEAQTACKEPELALPHAIPAQQPKLAQVARQGKNWPLKMKRNRVTDRVPCLCQTYDVRKASNPSFRILRVLSHPLSGGCVLCFLTHGMSGLWSQWMRFGTRDLNGDKRSRRRQRGKFDGKWGRVGLDDNNSTGWQVTKSSWLPSFSFPPEP